jgi:Ubiquitin fusion degradation protein UFD1
VLHAAVGRPLASELCITILMLNSTQWNTNQHLHKKRYRVRLLNTEMQTQSQMMDNLLLGVGDLVNLRNVSLPKGTFIKIQPHSKDFLDISNPKAVLETSLRSFTCLTQVCFRGLCGATHCSIA